jgi:lipid-binding SYLF domain-containing protein
MLGGDQIGPNTVVHLETRLIEQLTERKMSKFTLFLGTILLLAQTPAMSDFQPNTKDKQELAVAQAIIDIKSADPGMERFFEESAGYAVFPKVGKGGSGIGGAHGKGLVIVGDNAVGETSLSQVTVGFQLGGQVYAEVIFFKDDAALKNFQRGNFELGAQVSAVAVTAGASADANYDKGVAVFTHVSGGLMYEATVGGQKFKYEHKD